MTANPLRPHATSEADAARRLAEFRSLRGRGALCTAVTEQLATDAASAFLSCFEKRGEYLGDAITLLAEIATLEDPCLSEPGRRATFPLLVEQLSDSFEAAHCALYDRAFSQMITHCRSLPEGRALDAALRSSGLNSQADLLERKARLSQKRPKLTPGERAPVRRVLVLSRVTLGADVAVTSLVLQRAKSLFPQAQRALIGSPKLRQLFGGDPSLRFRHVQYDGGTLLARLQSWLPLLAAVEEEVGGLSASQYVLIDPDSRLLQLGLLPVVSDEGRYYFFESRTFGRDGPGSIGELTRRWLDETFGEGNDAAVYPAVWLPPEEAAWGREVCRRLRQLPSAKASERGPERAYLVAMSFGAGNSALKRIADPFEERLVEALLSDGCTVILDKGFGEEEAARAARLVERMKAGGWRAAELNEQNRTLADRETANGIHLLTWEGGIGAFAALIAASDEYIGYDSAGQHIAAASGVPALDIFTASTAPIFRERWRPLGPAMVKIALQPPDDPDGATVLAQVQALHSEIRSAQRKRA